MRRNVIYHHTFVVRSIESRQTQLRQNGIKKENTQAIIINNKNSSGDEIANVNFLRRYGTYVLQNTKKENLYFV